ncbi:DUF6082 family protein [Streptomyces sp. NPDC001493]
MTQRLSNALLLTLAAGTLASTVVSVVRLLQDKVHHQETKRIALGHLQDLHLSDLIHHPDQAALSKPDDLTVEQYLPLLSANRQICSTSTHFLAGNLSYEQMVEVAEQLMERANVRAYWKRYGNWRFKESEGDRGLTTFNRLMANAADTYPTPAPTRNAGV